MKNYGDRDRHRQFRLAVLKYKLLTEIEKLVKSCYSSDTGIEVIEQIQFKLYELDHLLKEDYR